MNTRFGWVLGLVLAAATAATAEPTSETNERLRAGLQRYPQADANRDGVLTAVEARDFLATRPRKGDATDEGLAPARADVPYGPHARNVLDFWPAAASNPTPVMVFIHGGGFRAGDKSFWRKSPALAAFLSNGVSCAAINYPFLKDLPVQTILSHEARAVQFLRSKAGDWNLDPARIGAWGGSAGAGSSLWLGSRDDLAAPASDDPVLRQSSRVRVAVMQNTQATYDLTKWETIAGPFRDEWKEDPNEASQFYHLPDTNAFATAAGRAILREVDMLGWIGPGDAAVFCINNTPDGEPRNRNEYVHSPRHAQAVQKACATARVPCELAKQDADGTARAVRFAVEHLRKADEPGKAPAAAASPKGARPNIVLIISDDHGWGDYGFMGHPHVRTPNLDRLAAESLCFPRGYSAAPLCSPSLASIITGLDVHRHGVTGNDPPASGATPLGARVKDPAFRDGREQIVRLFDRADNLPKALGRAGYVSLQTGKWWMGDYRRGGFNQGMTGDNPGAGGRHGDEGLAIGRQTMQPVYDFIDGAAKDGKPFFVWYAPMLPHQPHNPPERLLEHYRNATSSIHVARYWAMVEWFDETCGQLMDFVATRGLDENTIFAYVTDNGWIPQADSASPSPRSKLSPYDGGVRTPIMVRWKGALAPQKSDAPVSALDLMPTLLAMAGVPGPAGLPGIDLRDGKALAAREAVFGAAYTHNIVEIGKPASSLRFRWCVAGDWKLIVPSPAAPDLAQAPQLYDLARDPLEQSNRAASDPARVEQLRAKLDAWWPGASPAGS